MGNINGGGGSPFFKKTGNYQATHSINMAFKKLMNLSTSSEPYEAATKEYVDDIKKTTHPYIIAVHTHYSGNLRKDEYQFTFGGNLGSKLDTGFLVPQSGRIKKDTKKILVGRRKTCFYFFKKWFYFSLTRAQRAQGELLGW